MIYIVTLSPFPNSVTISNLYCIKHNVPLYLELPERVPGHNKELWLGDGDLVGVLCDEGEYDGAWE